MSKQRHPGYIIGDHWLEAAYSRICAGDNELETLADYGYVPAAEITRLRAELQQVRDRLRRGDALYDRIGCGCGGDHGYCRRCEAAMRAWKAGRGQ